MLCDITLYTPGGLFLDSYTDVDDDSIYLPSDTRRHLRFRREDNKVVKTTLPFLIVEK